MKIADARSPVRLRPMMIPSALEKTGYGGAVVVLYVRGRMQDGDLAFDCVDLLFAGLFLVALYKVRSA